LGASLLVAASPGGNSARFVKPPRIEARERAQGATWSQVAQALNRTRQAVEARFG
jgi:hypothetical protein